MDLWTNNGGWVRTPITGAVALLPPAPAPGLPSTGLAPAVIVPFDYHQTPAALLIARSAAVFLNGYPALPVAVLRDRDAITMGAATFYFAAHSATAEERFPGSERPTPCARCKHDLRPGDVVVLCPACRARHHEGELAASRSQAAAPEVRRCYTYDKACAACGRERSQLLWSPEEVEE